MNIDSFGIRIPPNVKVLTNRAEVWSKAIEIFDHMQVNLGRIAQNEMDLDLEMKRQLGMVWHPARTQSKAAKALVDLMTH